MRRLRSIIFFTPVKMDNYLLLTNIDVLVLRLAFLQRINQALSEFKELYKNHQLRADSHWTPN